MTMINITEMRMEEHLKMERESCCYHPSSEFVVLYTIFIITTTIVAPYIAAFLHMYMKNMYNSYMYPQGSVRLVSTKAMVFKYPLPDMRMRRQVWRNGKKT